MGGILATSTSQDPSPIFLAVILFGAAALWIGAAGVFSSVAEVAGATGGGDDALREALRRLNLLRSDPPFRRFVIVRALLISTGLAAPFYVALSMEHGGGGGRTLAYFLLASGLASALSSLFWGRYSDRSSRSVLIAAASAASSLGLVVFLLERWGFLDRFNWIPPFAFFLLAVAHSGIRIGRKTYILDMAGGARRTDYVAVSNTVIGAVLLASGVVGFLAPIIGSGGMLLLLSVMGFVGVLGGRTLPEAQ